ncbi:uncharacterized protein LOC121333415 [Onychostruthus taczanowskii]|uniref:uncharacterized protein LOC121333415 n=1 Tax=Onychostruthus taczanowskii TaxID=356909 RepID=UPI001B8024F3|nr:uncharacterized protein LOC121333415 [Onychostruthus taczanowskii]
MPVSILILIIIGLIYTFFSVIPQRQLSETHQQLGFQHVPEHVNYLQRPRLLVRLGGRAGRHSELLQRLANASPPRGRRTPRRSGAAGTERAWRGWRQAEPAGEREAVPSDEPPPSLAPARPPAGIPGGAAAPGRAAPPGCAAGRAAEPRRRGGAAASSCGTGPASAGGSVEAKNKNWQKLCSVYENMKSVLMTKHRNLENHRL